MAIFGLSADYFEHLSLETHPKRTYTSASNESSQPSGISGSVYVFAERSKFEKEAQPLLAFDDDANAMVYIVLIWRGHIASIWDGSLSP